LLFYFSFFPAYLNTFTSQFFLSLVTFQRFVLVPRFYISGMPLVTFQRFVLVPRFYISGMP
jgi:hypothetical protein